MIVTPAQAGVQFKDAWIPACAGMTDGQHASVLNNSLDNISGAQHYPNYPNQLDEFGLFGKLF
jgi:hypothetical protein